MRYVFKKYYNAKGNNAQDLMQAPIRKTEIMQTGPQKEMNNNETRTIFRILTNPERMVTVLPYGAF